MRNGLISVIVPVYNVEKYIARCLESILRQTYENLEIIVVDDGATDESGKICEQFAAKDNRIKVIHKTNGGLSDARNVGMQYAEGDYITFVDSDDYLDENFAARLYGICVKEHVEIAICRYMRTARDFARGEQNSTVETFTNVQALEQMLYQKKYNMSACAKLYKRELFEGISFPKGELYEDVNTIYKVIERSRRVGYCRDQLYFYYVNPNSITCNAFHEGKLAYVTHMEEVLSFIDREYPALRRAAEFRYIWANIHIWVHMPVDDRYKALEKKIRSNIKAYQWSVIWDRNIGIKNRMIVMMSYGGHRFMRLIFQLQDRVKG